MADHVTMRTDPRIGTLLPREVWRSLELSATGLVTEEVAERLGVSPSTVRSHMAQAMSALRTRSKLETVMVALQLGRIALPPA
jgi:DNA-binding NarL/FixJ family response regulator